MAETGPNAADLLFSAARASRMPMMVTDAGRPDHPIVFVNPAFTGMTGYSPEECLGRNCRFLQGPDTDPDTAAAIREALAGSGEIATEILNRRKDGSTFWNALFISPVRDPAGVIVHHLGLLLDVSHRRDTEGALRQAQKMEALGQLTGGIAHDFNNLLQVVIGYMDGMRSRLASHQDAYVRRALVRVTDAAERGATLTQQLLAFARKQRLEGRVVNLNALAEAAAERAREVLGREVAVDLRLAPGLWSAKLDPVHAEIAVGNVLANARDALKGRGTLSISTYNQPPPMPGAGGSVGLAIADDGEGMSSDILARVTEPFFTTKQREGGSGLGLSMVYGFMKQSRGSLAVESKPGGGTTVRLHFPAVEEADAPDRSAAAPAEPRSASGRETVLVVDDQPDVADLARMALVERGYRVLLAHDADRALALLAEPGGVDLLFSDLIMPGSMNGVLLAREARRRRPTLRVLLTTGYAEEFLEREGAVGVEFEVLGKPYRPADLARRVRATLDRVPAGA